MCKHLPLEIRQRLNLFMTEGYSEELFLSELERERVSYSLRIAAVETTNELEKDRRWKGKGTYNSYSAGQNRRPCAYCQNNSFHHWRYCPRKPQPGSCYDCLNPTHRRGDARCPGRGDGNSR